MEYDTRQREIINCAESLVCMARIGMFQRHGCLQFLDDVNNGQTSVSA